VNSQISVALIIGKNKDDVGLRIRRFCLTGKKENQKGIDRTSKKEIDRWRKELSYFFKVKINCKYQKDCSD
jgi:hypothetical protein